MSERGPRHAIDVDVYDTDAVRSWLMERIENEVKLNGQAHPRLILVADGYEESLDLDRMAKQEAGADAGATFQALRSRPNIERRFAVIGMLGEHAEGRERSFSILFEEIDDEGETRWWMAMQEYALDPHTGLGIPAAWTPSNGETNEIRNLFPFLQALARPDPTARAAQVLPPRQGQPDIQVAFGEIKDAAVVADAAKMAELAFQLVGAPLLDMPSLPFFDGRRVRSCFCRLRVKSRIHTSMMNADPSLAVVGIVGHVEGADRARRDENEACSGSAERAEQNRS